MKTIVLKQLITDAGKMSMIMCRYMETITEDHFELKKIKKTEENKRG